VADWSLQIQRVCWDRGVDTQERPGAAPEPEAVANGRSPAVAAGLSFLWPGLGQLLLGRRIAAAVLAIPAFLVAVVAFVQLREGLFEFATGLWDPSYFLIVVAVVCGFGLWRVLAVGHAFVTASRTRAARRVEVAFAAALVAAIVSMHGLFVAGAWAWYDTSVSIQNNDAFAEASPTPTTGPAATATPTPTPAPTLVNLSVFQPYATSGPTINPATVRVPNLNRITFLIVGFDFMTGRTHSLTDTMMLVSIDTKTEKAAIVSVPRDTSNFDLYYGGWVGQTFKLNSLLNAALSPRFHSPDPPMLTLEKEIGYLVGVPVDYYAAIDLAGFAKMIDAIGGVDVYNPKAIHDPTTATYVPAGPVHLDGTAALKYVRSRENGGSDYLRASRQQAVLVAAERKVASPAVLPHLAALLSLAGQTVSTDFPLSTARKYVSAATRASIQMCVLGPPYSYHPDTAVTGGTWTSRLNMARVANLSVELFGQDSRYYGQPGVVPAPCGK